MFKKLMLLGSLVFIGIFFATDSVAMSVDSLSIQFPPLSGEDLLIQFPSFPEFTDEELEEVGGPTFLRESIKVFGAVERIEEEGTQFSSFEKIDSSISRLEEEIKLVEKLDMNKECIKERLLQLEATRNLARFFKACFIYDEMHCLDSEYKFSFFE